MPCCCCVVFDALVVVEGTLNVGCCACCGCCDLVLRDSCLGFGGSGFLGSGDGRAGEGDCCAGEAVVIVVVAMGNR